MSDGKGILLAVLSGLSTTTSFIFIKYLLGYLPAGFLLLLWFASATAISIIAICFHQHLNPLSYLMKNWKEGLALGFVSVICAAMWALSIKLMGPSLTAFFLRFTTIFIIVLGVFILREKMNLLEVFGAIIAILGALIISFNGGNITLFALAVAVLMAFSSAIQDFVAKLFISKISKVKAN